MKAYRNIVFWMIVLVLAGVDLILVKRTMSYKKEIALKDSLMNSMTISSHKFHYLENCLWWSLNAERIRIPDQQIMDTTGGVCMLGEMIEQGPVLVFRYKEKDCQACVNFGMMKLDEFAKREGIRPVVFAHYQEQLPFKIGSRTMNVPKFPVYNVKYLDFVDDIDAPCYFILHEDLSIGELFVPEKLFPDFTNRYLHLIGEKYFSKNMK